MTAETESTGWAGDRLHPLHEHEELVGAAVPSEVDESRVRVEVARRGDGLAIRVRSPDEVWTVDVSRMDVSTRRASELPEWARVVLDYLGVAPGVTWQTYDETE